MPVGRLLLGRPLPSSAEAHERLSKPAAIGAFGLDALSSVAYGPDEILYVLVLAGAAGVALDVRIAGAIAVLLAIVAFSYRQTIYAYPQGGGSFTVASANLGPMAGLFAAAALMVDYLTTVAVSVTAGVAAIVAFWPWLDTHRVIADVIIIAFLIGINLRGVREAGAAFIVPTYVFVGSIAALLVVGVVRAMTGHAPAQLHPDPAAVEAVSVFIVLRAFAGGCTAMTGVEAIANGVPAFKPPESRNAAQTLTMLALVLGVLFLGIAALGGSTHALIPLFAVGVFLCFTLSQAGMVVHWRRERSRGWRVKLAINGLGAITTGVVTLVVAGTKFVDGAWIVVLLVPFLVANFWAMHRHYMIALRQLAVIPPRRPVVRERVLIPVRGLNRAVAEAVQYALSITDPDRITAVHVVVEGEEDKGDKEELERAWHEWVPEVALHCVSSPYREVIAPVLHVIDDLLEKSDVPVTVLLPEVLPHAWYEEPLHNQLAIAFKLALLYKPGVVVTSVPVRLTG